MEQAPMGEASGGEAAIPKATPKNVDASNAVGGTAASGASQGEKVEIPAKGTRSWFS